jgi:hypothetical protein
MRAYPMSTRAKKMLMTTHTFGMYNEMISPNESGIKSLNGKYPLINFG